jgi:hypothetical protein
VRERRIGSRALPRRQDQDLQQRVLTQLSLAKNYQAKPEQPRAAQLGFQRGREHTGLGREPLTPAVIGAFNVGSLSRARQACARATVAAEAIAPGCSLSLFAKFCPLQKAEGTDRQQTMCAG